MTTTTAPTVWRPLQDFSRYEVNELGQVRSWRPYRGDDGPRFLSPSPGKGGYLKVALQGSAGSRTVFVHRLVAAAFHGPCPEGHEVRHLNGDRLDNTPGNLTYGTSADNKADMVAHGTHRNVRKQACPQGHPYDDANTRFRRNGWRSCRTCSRNRVAR